MKKLLTAMMLTMLLGLFGCTKDETANSDPAPGSGSFTDYGTIPAAVNIGATFQSMVYHNNAVWVATTDGIWKNDLNTRQWSRAGLNGRNITLIYKHPSTADRLYAGAKSDERATTKTFYTSADGGTTWTAAATPVFDSLNNRYENYACLAARPGHPTHLYANLESGNTIAVSKDGGNTWVRSNYLNDSYFGFGCNIAFLPGNPNQLFQGAEIPLDIAWLGRHNISAADPVLLSGFTKIVDSDRWGNRRPNELLAFSNTGNSLYVGQEGAVSKVTDSTLKFIFKSENGNYPYTYVEAIWVDPENPSHLLFGGGLNNTTQPMQLYETYDEGATIHLFTDKLGLPNPIVYEIVQTGTVPAILLGDQGGTQVKLVLYNPDGGS